MKTKIKHLLTLAFSAVIVVAVFLTATHAKDIVGNTAHSKHKARAIDTQVARATQDDPVQKSMGDLHSHTDKTMLKHFVKQVGDTATLATKRTEKDDMSDEQPFSMRLFEAFFMMQLAFAYARS